MSSARRYRAPERSPITNSRYKAPEATNERPSSFREMLYRDRGLLSRRQMDRRIADRMAERDEAASNGNGEIQPTYFPGLSRAFNGGTAAVIRSTTVVAVLVLTAFLFGLWVGRQSVPEPAPRSATVATLA